MCIRDSLERPQPRADLLRAFVALPPQFFYFLDDFPAANIGCLLYTSDAADEEDSVDLGVAVDVAVKIEHELDDGPLQSRPGPAQHVETRAAHLDLSLIHIYGRYP